MVKIDKSTVAVPVILDLENPISRAAVELVSLQKKFDAGQIHFKFKSSIYGHSTVKEALSSAQHGKCCFCESKIGHISYGDNEHYRPKGGYYSQPKEKISRPGYYWLAYDFTNLYLACQICNQSYKKNYFPLKTEASRTASHHHSVNLINEQPLIIDPGLDNPQAHLTFDREVPRGLDDKGKITILRIGLDRKKLNEYRLTWYRLVADIARHARAGDIESRSLMQEAAQSSEPYSLMVRSNFPDLITG